MNIKLYLGLFLLLVSYSASAIEIKGKVVDENNLPVSFATILVKNSSMGTSANNAGDYQLDLKPGTYTITCKTIGYKAVSKTVNLIDAEVILDFKLSAQSLSLSDVVISAKKEDPAYDIMRKVIAKRKYHAELIRTLETDIYLKGGLRTRSIPDNIFGIAIQDGDMKEVQKELGLDSNGKGIIYLLEEMSHYYYQAPNKSFNEVKSVRTSGDPKGLGFATMPPIINIYENNITVLGGLNERGFISPAHSNAFQYYKYQFLGTFMEDDKVISKIKITPKRKYEPLFSGYLYVVDGEWLFQGVDLILTRESQINDLDTLKFEQNYRPLAKDIWVIQSQVLYPSINIIGIDIIGSFVTSYNNQKINHTIPADKFKSKIISSYDTNAMNKTVAYWDTIRPIPLEKEEKLDFIVKDSVFHILAAKTDSLKNTVQIKYSFLLSGIKGTYKDHEFFVRPLVTAINFNSVEGLNATLDMNYMYHFTKNKTLKTQLLNRYGFGNQHYNILGKVGMTIEDPNWKTKSWTWELTGGKYVYQINPDNPISPVMDEIYTLLGGRNYMKLYENQLGKLKLNRNWGNGLSASLALSYEQRNPLFNATDYSFSAKHDKRITPNQPANLPNLKQQDAAIVDASISYQPGWKFVQYPEYKMPIGSELPRFTLNYTKGIPSIFNSVSDFDKWSVEMSHSLRLRMLGTVDYRLETGGFLNKKEVNLPDYNHVNGNQTIFANSYLNAFQLAPYYEYSNTNEIYFQGNIEWHLGGLFTNKIPLFKRLNWFLLAGANMQYININNNYTEVFVGLENIGYKFFRFGRVDFIAGYRGGLNKPDLGVRISFGQVFESLLGMRKNTEL